MAVVNGEIKCSKCQISKALEHFNKGVREKGCGTCKVCAYEYSKAWRQRNLEKVAAQKRQRYALNSEEEARRARERRAARRDEINERSREWLAQDKERAKGYNLKRYGITLEQYQQMLAEQGGGCAICGAEENKNGKALFVDHCHDTGKVRGVLCHRCNTGLGSFKDNAALVAKAASYLSGDK